jgi:hypothetical protein
VEILRPVCGGLSWCTGDQRATTLSLAHMTVLDAHPLELIDAAAAGGFDYIGLRIVPQRQVIRSSRYAARSR